MQTSAWIITPAYHMASCPKEHPRSLRCPFLIIADGMHLKQQTPCKLFDYAVNQFMGERFQKGTDSKVSPEQTASILTYLSHQCISNASLNRLLEALIKSATTDDSERKVTPH